MISSTPPLNSACSLLIIDSITPGMPSPRFRVAITTETNCWAVGRPLLSAKRSHPYQEDIGFRVRNPLDLPLSDINRPLRRHKTIPLRLAFDYFVTIRQSNTTVPT